MHQSTAGVQMPARSASSGMRVLQHRGSHKLAVFRKPCRRHINTRCSLTAKGKAFPATALQVKRTMGEGSFGQVFEGTLENGRGVERVVLKRVKTKVEGAEEMAQMEHLMNVHASKVAKGSCADFVGYCEVAPEEATVKLSSGLWLLWKYEGSKTLAYYLRRRDTIPALAADLGIPESAVISTVMKQIFEGLAALHGQGLVHRDIKPLNIIFADDFRRFKLIDLGACADLRTGTNYVPDESILDPNYCPPEQYVLPTDSPHLAKSPLALAISPMLWAQYKPDRFDIFSTGLIMMQLALPSLRSERALKTFRSSLRRCEYDLKSWRQGAALSRFETELLDADNGAGWDLAQALLLPRSVVFEDDGGVLFLNDGSALRISASDAMKHRFMAQAVAPGSAVREAAPVAVPAVAGAAAGAATAAGGGEGGGFNVGKIWSGWKDRFFAMEAMVAQTASATQRQTQTVRKLKKDVAEGRASNVQLQQEEAQLAVLQQQLQGVQTDLKGMLAQGANLFRNIGLSPTVKDGTGTSTEQRAGSSSTRSGSTAQQQASSPAKSGLWDRLARQLVALEIKIDNQESATEKLSFTVKKLRREVALGQADPEQLKRAEGLYSKMQRRLGRLQRDYTEAKASVSSLVGLISSEDAIGSTDTRPSIATSSTGSSSTRPASTSTTTTPAPAGTSSGSGWFGWGRKDEPATAAPTVTAQGTPVEAQKEKPASGPGQFFSAGLKLTGFAAKMAGDIASSLREDAERMLKEAEAKERQKQRQRETDTAFMAVMKSSLPGLRSTASYAEVAQKLAGNPAFEAVKDERRRVLVGAYLETLKQKEVVEAAQARTALKDMYVRRGADHDSKWEVFRAQVDGEPAFHAVDDERLRREVFEEVVAQAETSRMMRGAQFRAEQGFLQLLTEVQDPPVTAESSWALVKPQMWSDPRFQALAEPHRRAMFLQYRNQLANTAAAAVAAVERNANISVISRSVSPAPAAREAAKPEPMGISFQGGARQVGEVETAAEKQERVRMEELKKEQERLKQEYARMEAKLKQMEEKLKRSSQLQREMERGEDGSAVAVGGKPRGDDRWSSMAANSNGVNNSDN